jgi:hypothetical protein
MHLRDLQGTYPGDRARGCTKLRNEIETQRNETKYHETQWNETKYYEAQHNEAKYTKKPYDPV